MSLQLSAQKAWSILEGVNSHPLLEEINTDDIYLALKFALESGVEFDNVVKALVNNPFTDISICMTVQDTLGAYDEAGDSHVGMIASILEDAINRMNPNNDFKFNNSAAGRSMDARRIWKAERPPADSLFKRMMKGENLRLVPFEQVEELALRYIIPRWDEVLKNMSNIRLDFSRFEESSHEEVRELFAKYRETEAALQNAEANLRKIEAINGKSRSLFVGEAAAALDYAVNVKGFVEWQVANLLIEDRGCIRLEKYDRIARLCETSEASRGVVTAKCRIEGNLGRMADPSPGYVQRILKGENLRVVSDAFLEHVIDTQGSQWNELRSNVEKVNVDFSRLLGAKKPAVREFAAEMIELKTNQKDVSS